MHCFSFTPDYQNVFLNCLWHMSTHFVAHIWFCSDHVLETRIGQNADSIGVKHTWWDGPVFVWGFHTLHGSPSALRHKGGNAKHGLLHRDANKIKNVGYLFISIYASLIYVSVLHLQLGHWPLIQMFQYKLPSKCEIGNVKNMGFLLVVVKIISTSASLYKQKDIQS